MRRLIRWAIYLFILLVVLAVAGVLLLNRIVKEMMESRLRSNTGMDARIGLVDVGLLNPTFTIENLKIYNTPDFGGSLFLNLPELHVEYDPLAMRTGTVHCKLVRLNIAELNLIQDKKGRLNIQGIEKNSPIGKDAHGHPGVPAGGLDLKFGGIDTLNLTLGKMHISNLANGAEQEIDFGIKNQITHNIKSQADLAGLNFLLMARSGALSSTNSALDFSSLLKTLTAP